MKEKLLSILLVLLLIFGITDISKAQKGVYLTVDGGLSLGYKDPIPALRMRGEFKWMFLPYLGAGVDVTMQRPGLSPNIAPLSSLTVSPKGRVSSQYISSVENIVEATRMYSLSLVFQPIAIKERQTRHMFAVALGGGLALGYSQSWDLPSFAGYQKVEYYYSKFFDAVASLDLSYAYRVYGPFFIGAHAGCTAQVRFAFYYIYCGATLGLHFGTGAKQSVSGE